MRIDCLSYSVETFSCVHGNLECPDYEDSLDQTYKNCVTNPLSPPITCTWLNLNIVDPATGAHSNAQSDQVQLLVRDFILVL